jgi:hypothetical protein
VQLEGKKKDVETTDGNKRVDAKQADAKVQRNATCRKSYPPPDCDAGQMVLADFAPVS